MVNLRPYKSRILISKSINLIDIIKIKSNTRILIFE